MNTEFVPLCIPVPREALRNVRSALAALADHPVPSALFQTLTDPEIEAKLLTTGFLC